MRYLLALMLITTISLTSRIAAAQTATPTPTPVVYQATPVADTYVRNRLAEQTVNYGATNSVLYRRLSTNNATAFIYWGLPEAQAKNVVAATMWFNVTTNPQPVALWETWPIDESLLFASAPPAVNFLGIITPTLGWNSYDITGSVRDNKTVMFIAAGADSTLVTFTTIGSRQSVTSPYIRYQLAPTPTPTITPTPSATATPAASSELIELPSGNMARVEMTATAGELFVAGVLVLVVFVLLWPAVMSIAKLNARQ